MGYNTGRSTPPDETGPTVSMPFWEDKPLDELAPEEWEALCDGCGRCCLTKLEDADTGDVYYTDVACTLLDLETCRCRDYPHRSERVPDCVRLSPDAAHDCFWLPHTCAYRLRAEGRPLPEWHPLITGTPATVRTAGLSACAFAVGEDTLTADDDLEDHLLEADT